MKTVTTSSAVIYVGSQVTVNKCALVNSRTVH